MAAAAAASAHGTVRLRGILHDAGFATLLLDLLTESEEAIDAYTSKYRFDVERLGHRVSAAVDWAGLRLDIGHLRVGCFGASTGAAAALIAAAERPALIVTVVSRGGRPDLAGNALARVVAPTLLIVGGRDEPVIGMNRTAMRQMHAPVRLEIVPGATHLFEEPGALRQVANLATDWYVRHLCTSDHSRRGVAPKDWLEFLAGFSRRHRVWLVTVEQVTPTGVAHVVAAWRPLESVAVVAEGADASALEIRFKDGASPRRVLVPNPATLNVDETAEGVERGIEIEDQNGLRTTLRFRVAARPDEVDQRARGEL